MRLRLLFIAMLVLPAISFAEPIDFDKQVAPILISRCLDCHTGEDGKGSLDLTTLKGALVGGDTDHALVPKKPEQSLLWRKINNDRMPPKKPLSEGEKKILKTWITEGGKWGTDPIDPNATTTTQRAGRDWWALQPVKRPNVPQEGELKGLQPIDAFIRAKLKEKKLTPSPEADPRTLIRRVYFDLVGLPPPIEVLEKFAKDPSDKAYRQIVDELLASPQYGERWARHWLDVVRYGESQGFERNDPRPTAYHYRDFVIKALNSDMPYDQFAKYQLAGDAIRAYDHEAVKATGFLVAGIHNTVLGSNAIANMTARQDELEDVISTVGQTFLGLTVACARCHDHKFDPITQKDYYRMVANLAGVTHGEKNLIAIVDPKYRDYRETITKMTFRLNELETTVRERALAEIRKKSPDAMPIVAPLVRWSFAENGNDQSGKLNLVLKGAAKIEKGKLILDGKGAYAISPPLKSEVKQKTLEAWVKLGKLDQGGGGVITIETGNGATFDSIVYAERQPKKWMVGSNGFQRTQPVNGIDEDSVDWVHVAIVYDEKNKITFYRNGKLYGTAYTLAGSNPVPLFKAEESRILLGLRHSGGGNAYLAGEIDEARLYDRALTADEIALSAKLGPDVNGLTQDEIEKAYTLEEVALRKGLQIEIKTLMEKLVTTTKTEKVFATVGVATPKTHLLARGDVTKPRDEVLPGGISALKREYQLKANSNDFERRKELADWIADAKNPLFTRTLLRNWSKRNLALSISTD